MQDAAGGGSRRGCCGRLRARSALRPPRAIRSGGSPCAARAPLRPSGPARGPWRAPCSVAEPAERTRSIDTCARVRRMCTPPRRLSCRSDVDCPPGLRRRTTGAWGRRRGRLVSHGGSFLPDTSTFLPARVQSQFACVLALLTPIPAWFVRVRARMYSAGSCSQCTASEILETLRGRSCVCAYRFRAFCR